MGPLPSASPPARIDAWRWRVVWLLFLATMLNYMDRQALNQTSAYLIAEFRVPYSEQETVYGTLEAAFGYSFAVFQLLAGLIADKLSIRKLYLAALLIWSAAGFLTGIVPAGALGALIACRVLLGFGEAFNWPCAVAAVRRVVPRESWGLANGFFHSGATVGAVATPLLVLALVPAYPAAGLNAAAGPAAGWTLPPPGEWRIVFLLIGAGGVAWAAAWLLVTRGEVGRAIDTRPPDEPASEGGPATGPSSVWDIFRGKQFWLMLAVGCSVNLTWHFFRTWFVRYLQKDLGRAADEVQWLTLGFFLAADLGALTSGFAIRTLTRRGVSVERSRKWAHVGVAAACLLAVPATQVPGVWAKMALFYLVAAGAMGGYAIYFSLAQDIVGKHTALMIGLGGFAAWVLIATSSQIVGPWADAQGSFVPAIVCASLIPVAGMAAGWLWPEPKRAAGE